MNGISLYRVWDILKNLCILCILWLRHYSKQKRNDGGTPKFARLRGVSERQGSEGVKAPRSA